MAIHVFLQLILHQSMIALVCPFTLDNYIYTGKIVAAMTCLGGTEKSSACILEYAIANLEACHEPELR